MRLSEELKQKHPGMAHRAERSPLAAIRLFCLECMGGSAMEVSRCATTECTLHRFRDGHRVPMKGVADALDEGFEAPGTPGDLEEG